MDWSWIPGDVVTFPEEVGVVGDDARENLYVFNMLVLEINGPAASCTSENSCLRWLPNLLLDLRE